MMIKAGQTVYLTKYAMSGEVVRAEVEGPGYSPNYMRLKRRVGLWKLGADFHVGKPEAIQAIEAMRVKKLASLDKQIAKLKKMDPAALVEAADAKPAD